MFLHVPHDVLQIIAMGAGNHMDMAAHNAPAINFQSLFLLAMFPTVRHNVFIFVPDEKVYSVHNCKTYKVKLVLVSKFIFGTHNKLKYSITRHCANIVS